MTGYELMDLYHQRKSGFSKWYLNASEIEKELFDLVFNYSEKYFSDFRFEPGTISDDFVRIEYTDDNGETIEATESVPDILEFFNIIVLEAFQYKVELLDEGTVGSVDTTNLILTITPGAVNDQAGKPDILHEIIHMYECAFEILPKFYHDILLVSLYKKLKEVISDLDERIVMHTHVILGEQITSLGGDHDVLFLLKSFDLDLQCGYKLGTVCGYGRNEY